MDQILFESGPFHNFAAMAKTGIARGGDEVLRPQSFYGNAPARPAALRTVDADGNSNVGVNKALTRLHPQGVIALTVIDSFDLGRPWTTYGAW